jgi:hypothetical protein
MRPFSATAAPREFRRELIWNDLRVAVLELQALTMPSKNCIASHSQALNCP